VARDYWVAGGAMQCIASDGEEKLIALGTIDLDQTVVLNRERKVEFVLRSKDMVEQ
jgi:hypothetical protein